MNWKQFLKLDWMKIVLTVIFIGLSYFHKFVNNIPDASFLGVGLPIPYYRLSGSTFGGVIGPAMLWEGLIIDLIFWYLVSCLIIWIFNKVRKK